MCTYTDTGTDAHTHTAHRRTPEVKPHAHRTRYVPWTTSRRALLHDPMVSVLLTLPHGTQEREGAHRFISLFLSVSLWVNSTHRQHSLSSPRRVPILLFCMGVFVYEGMCMYPRVSGLCSTVRPCVCACDCAALATRVIHLCELLLLFGDVRCGECIYIYIYI